MKSLSDVLEGIPEGRVVAVRFTDGEELWLKNFTPVDESIYDKPGLFTAVLECVIDSTKKGRRSNVGSAIQFATRDVQHVIDLVAKRFLFHGTERLGKINGEITKGHA